MITKCSFGTRGKTMPNDTSGGELVMVYLTPSEHCPRLVAIAIGTPRPGLKSFPMTFVPDPSIDARISPPEQPEAWVKVYGFGYYVGQVQSANADQRGRSPTIVAAKMPAAELARLLNDLTSRWSVKVQTNKELGFPDWYAGLSESLAVAQSPERSPMSPVFRPFTADLITKISQWGYEQ